MKKKLEHTQELKELCEQYDEAEKELDTYIDERTCCGVELQWHDDYKIYYCNSCGAQYNEDFEELIEILL